MKSLQEIKNIVAKENGTNWNELMSDCGGNSKEIQCYTDAVAKIYAEEVLKEAAEKSMILFHDGTTKENKSLKYFQSGADNIQPDKLSILNIIKELK